MPSSDADPPANRDVSAGPASVSKEAVVSAPTVSLTLSPIPLIIGSVTMHGEFSFADHHALEIVFSPLIPSPLSNGAGGIDVSLGYRLYPMNPFDGLTLGVDLLTGFASGLPFIGDAGYYGMGMNLGWKWIVGDTFTIGVGGGVQVLSFDSSPLVRPTLDFELGVSF